MNETEIRIGVALTVIAVLLASERLWPIRPRYGDYWRRLADNFLLFSSGALLVRFVVPLTLTAVAFGVQRQGFGLVYWFELPSGLAFLLSWMLLDFWLYLQHLLMHRFTILWRLHRVHHSDTDVDWTTGIRFHPGEILVSVVFKIAAVGLLGALPAAVLLFELMLNAFSLFTHSNLRIHPRVDRLLRCVLVTPAMHWIHHSKVVAESQSNFGFCLSLWDRLFRTYRGRAETELSAIVLGVRGLGGHSAGVASLLVQPTIADPEADDYRIGSRQSGP